MIRWLFILSLAFISLAGCSHQPVANIDAANPDKLQRALSGEAMSLQWTAESLPTYHLFSLTPEMKVFAEQAVSRQRTPYLRAQALHAALLKPKAKGGAGLRYQGYVTGTPVEAFASGDVNCVSFTLLYVAMARHVGLNAAVNEVDLPMSWDMRNNNTFLLLRHVNAKVRLGRDDALVVDLDMARYNPTYPQRTISDDLAAAQFYNNRAMEQVTRDNLADGFFHLRKALLLEEDQSYIWNNFGTLLRRANLLEEAEAAYLHGLALNSRDLTIINNLMILYRYTGVPEKAEQYVRLAENYHRNNPFYRYSMAMESMENGDLTSARTRILEAINMRKNEPMFYDLAAAIYLALDDADEADRMQAKSRHFKNSGV